MGDEIRENLKEGLRKTFENMPPEMWCGVSAMLLAETKNICVEYYERGQEELRKRWELLLEFICNKVREED